MARTLRQISSLLVLTLFSATAFAQVPDIDNPAILEAFIDGTVRSLMKDNNSPSGTVAIARNGQLVFAKGYGFEDFEERVPVDPYQTLFRPGSVSKLFTWVAIMQLVEEGKLDLDTDINTYLESFQIRDTFEEPITLRHVLTHTTGFEDGALGYLIIDDPERVMPLAESMARYQPARVNPPGVQTAYSNYATAVAGLIVSNVSGLPFNDYLDQYLFAPLAMQRSTFAEPLPEGFEERMATSYVPEAGKYEEKPFEIISNFGPAGALSATSVDMVRFGQAILNGGELDGARVIETDTLEQMLTRAYSHDPRLMGMALGFYEQDVNGYRLVGHGGDTQYFHSYLGIDKENELTFFVSFGGTGGSTVRSVFTPAFYNHFFPRDEEPPVPMGGSAERLARFAGTYGFWRSNFSTIERAFGLGGSVTVAPTEEGTLILSLADAAKQYVEVEENLFQEMNAEITLISGISPRLIAFQEDESGAITGFVLDGLPFMSLRRLPAVATPAFNFTMIGLSLLIFLGVIVRRFYQRAAIRTEPDANRAAINSAVYAAVANWLVVISGAIVITIVQDSLFSEIPTLFKAWLVVPIIAFVAGIFLIYRTIAVWRQGLLAGVWARIRFSIVAACALFMCWFYYYWNILGFQYL